MKISIPVILIAIVGAIAVSAQTPDKDVLAAMDRWKQGMIQKDRAGLEKILRDDLIFSHSDGHTWTKAELVDSVMSGKTNIDSMEFSDIAVRVYGDTALMRCRIDLTSSANGKSSAAHVNVLHVLLKGPQGWQLLVRQATKLAQ
jgi:ketosteroid isomerase-like protein